MSESLAYIAGLLDGEGSVSVKVQSTKGRLYYSICVRISNTNESAIDYVGTMLPGYKGSHTPKNGNRTMHEVGWYGADAIEVLELLEPYLIIKSSLSSLAREFWYECFDGRVRQDILTDADRIVRDSYRRRMDSMQMNNKRSTYG